MQQIKVSEFGYRVDTKARNPENGKTTHCHVDIVVTEKGPRATIILWDESKFWKGIELVEMPDRDQLEQTVEDLFKRYVNPYVEADLRIMETETVFMGAGEIKRKVCGVELPPKRWRVTTRPATQLVCDWVTGTKHKEQVIQARSIWPKRWVINNLREFSETLENLLKAQTMTINELVGVVTESMKK